MKTTAKLVSTVAGGHISLKRAYALIEDAGGFTAFCRAIDDPSTVPAGLSERAAERIRAALALGLRVAQASAERPTIVNSSDDIAAILGPRLRGLDHEQVWILGLSNRNESMGVRMIAEGGLHGCALLARDVIRAALRFGSTAFVMAHNHPGGDSRPSSEDIHLTRAILSASVAVGLPLVDHIIITRSGYTSMLSLGLLSSSETCLKAADGIAL